MLVFRIKSGQIPGTSLVFGGHVLPWFCHWASLWGVLGVWQGLWAESPSLFLPHLWLLSAGLCVRHIEDLVNYEQNPLANNESSPWLSLGNLYDFLASICFPLFTKKGYVFIFSVVSTWVSLEGVLCVGSCHFLYLTVPKSSLLLCVSYPCVPPCHVCLHILSSRHCEPTGAVSSTWLL